MDRDEALSTRIWLEEHENRAVVTKKQQRNFKIHKFNKTTLSSIQQFSKKNKISWEILITSAWGFLLNHFCTNDMTNFGITTLVAKGKDSFKIQFPIKPIKSVIDEKVTIETFIKKMKTQHNKKTIKKRK